MEAAEAVWRAYAAALSGCVGDKIPLALGVSKDHFKRLQEEEPEIGKAIEAAQLLRKTGESSLNMVDDAELRELWDTVTGENADAKQRALMALAEDGEVMKQRLLLYALDTSMFDIQKAMRSLNISKRMYERWTKDPMFMELVEEIEFRKKNFVEAKLMQKINQGSEKATIFAAQTLLKDRGFGLGIEVTGQINHVVGVVDLMSLDLAPEVRMAIIEAVQNSGMVDSDGMLIESTANVVG